MQWLQKITKSAYFIAALLVSSSWISKKLQYNSLFCEGINWQQTNIFDNVLTDLNITWDWCLWFQRWMSDTIGLFCHGLSYDCAELIQFDGYFLSFNTSEMNALVWGISVLCDNDTFISWYECVSFSLFQLHSMLCMISPNPDGKVRHVSQRKGLCYLIYLCHILIAYIGLTDIHVFMFFECVSLACCRFFATSLWWYIHISWWWCHPLPICRKSTH